MLFRNSISFSNWSNWSIAGLAIAMFIMWPIHINRLCQSLLVQPRHFVIWSPAVWFNSTDNWLFIYFWWYTVERLCISISSFYSGKTSAFPQSNITFTLSIHLFCMTIRHSRHCVMTLSALWEYQEYLPIVSQYSNTLGHDQMDDIVQMASSNA